MRSQWKGENISYKLYKRYKKNEDEKQITETEVETEAPTESPMKDKTASGVHYIWERSCTILEEFEGLTLYVYNGRKFIPIIVTSDMVGHKLGEFAPTRQPCIYKKKEKNKKKKKK